jgi:hypothetical protein
MSAIKSIPNALFRHPGQVRAQLEREPGSSARLAEGTKYKEPSALFSWIPDRRSLTLATSGMTGEGVVERVNPLYHVMCAPRVST